MAFTSITSFAKNESGAVTVDWVVLSAALVGLGVAVVSVVSGGMQDLSTDISQSLSDTNPNTSPFSANEEAPAPEEGGDG